MQKATAGFVLGGAVFTQGVYYYDVLRPHANVNSSHSWHCIHILARQQRQEGLVHYHHFQRHIAAVGDALDDICNGWT